MTKEIVTTKIAVFQKKEIRKIIHKNDWWFSVIDIIEALTGTERPRKYWNDLKKKLIKEGYSEVSEKIGQTNLEKQRKKIDQAMPKLLSFYAKQGGRPSVEYFDDDEGIKKILEDVLDVAEKQRPKEYRVFSSRSVREYLYKLFPNYTRERIKKGVRIKVVALGKGGDFTNLELAERKGVETDSPAYTLIYGHKIALISVADDNIPFGVIINDKKIAETQRIIFEELFSRLK